MTKRTNSTRPTVREQVNAQLRRGGETARVTNAEWRKYGDEGWWTPDEIYDRIIEDRRRGRTIAEPDHTTPTANAELAEWVTARTLLAARGADVDPRLIAWRDQHLPDRQLLTTDRAPEWITEQAAMAGPPSRFVTAQVPADWQQGQPIHTDGQHVGVSVRSLPYVEGSVLAGARYVGGHVGNVGTVTGSPLDQLRDLSEYLATRHGWSPATATMYVLTGIAPTPQLLSVSVKNQWVSGEVGRQLVTVSADPDVPVDVVAAAFRAQRVKLRGPRARLPQVKLSRLAAYAAQHSQAAHSMKQLRDWWNAEQPACKYLDLRSFRQALRDAERRVVGQPRQHR
jgi:hypothetical protein